jgi:ectoine hydroxylase-related dioxygenase (phytanoyl-CoA dioxygenase family)
VTQPRRRKGAVIQKIPNGLATAEAVLEALAEDGFVVVEGAVASDVAREARLALRSLLQVENFQLTGFLGRRTKRLYSVPSRTRACDAMLLHPLFSAVFHEVLGHHLLSNTTVTDIFPGEAAQTLHTDDSSWPSHLLAVAGDIQLGVLWALDDFTEENGATMLVPGSHRWPPERRRATGGEPTIPAAMTAGSALVYSGRVLHGGGANRSVAPRLGLVTTWVRSWLRQQEQFVVTCPPDVARHFPPRLRELVGYDVYPPLLGHVNARPPQELFDGGIRRLLESAESEADRLDTERPRG